MIKRFTVMAVCAMALCAAFAEVKEDVVRATGVASGYRAAVNEALAMALEQHEGISLGTTERQVMAQEDSAVSTRENGELDDKSKLEMNDSISKSMQKWAKGKISGYTVVADSIDENGKYNVVVDVRFPGKYVVGRDPDSLRRMAVAPFNVRRGKFSWYGQTVDSVDWSSVFANKLNVALSQTRKFTMLDRSFEREVNAELARIGGANAAPRDAIRLNQKLGTDYLVVGEVSFSDVAAPGVNPLTGQPLPRQSAIFAEIDYRVILAPTGQLKWADTVRLDALVFDAASVGDFVSMTAEAAAVEVCDGLMDNILPFEVADMKSGLLVIGEGGKRLAPGDRFAVCTLGDAIRDTRTGEVIDTMEIPVATAEVVTVGAKLSYAKVIEGDASQVTVGSRLRRIRAPEAVPAPPSPSPTIFFNGTGGVATPF